MQSTHKRATRKQEGNGKLTVTLDAARKRGAHPRLISQANAYQFHTVLGADASESPNESPLLHPFTARDGGIIIRLAVIHQDHSYRKGNIWRDNESPTIAYCTTPASVCGHRESCHPHSIPVYLSPLMVSESRDRRGIAPPPVHREKREAEQTHSMDIVIVLHNFQQTHIPFTVLGVSRTLVWRSRDTRCRTPRARAALHATRAEGNIPRCGVYTTAAGATIAGDARSWRHVCPSPHRALRRIGLRDNEAAHLPQTIHVDGLGDRPVQSYGRARRIEDVGMERRDKLSGRHGHVKRKERTRNSVSRDRVTRCGGEEPKGSSAQPPEGRLQGLREGLRQEGVQGEARLHVSTKREAAPSGRVLALSTRLSLSKRLGKRAERQPNSTTPERSSPQLGWRQGHRPSSPHTELSDRCDECKEEVERKFWELRWYGSEEKEHPAGSTSEGRYQSAGNIDRAEVAGCVYGSMVRNSEEGPDKSEYGRYGYKANSAWAIWNFELGVLDAVAHYR
ncbi:hypothetical protein B0H10DRAFT_1952183 [Mycena sp. CBHHK59/15]|nr:hypothetical protein B0H10DRAFT_1952183 [Mycena sp. CBHHK59/15]